MRVCVVTDDPFHPLLVGLAELLKTRHRVDMIDSAANPWAPAEPTDPPSPADVCLLKGHSPRALALARAAEERGALVLNGAAPTEFCQDRARMAERARAGGLPFPHTYGFARLSSLIACTTGSGALGFPMVVKSRRSGRKDLVRRVDGLEGLSALRADWAQEPVVVQKHVPNDGWDHKAWVVGDEVFVGLRRTPLEPEATRATLPVDADDLPPGWLDMIRDVGRLFDLQVYGVDIFSTHRGPVIVDVNAFPGCRGVRGAPEALAALVGRSDPVRDGPGVGLSVRPGRAPPTPVSRPFPGSGREARTGQRGRKPIAVLHAAVSALVGALDGAAGADGTDAVAPVLRVRYLRHEPGQGLVACYRATRGSRSPPRLLTVRISEQRLGEHRSWPSTSGHADEPGGSQPGFLRYPWTGLSLQAFPSDPDLPGLPAALAPAQAPALAAQLQAACRSVTGDLTACLVEVRMTPVRYKPGSWCVVRYRLRVATAGSSSGPAAGHQVILFGKVYSAVTDAVAAHRTAEWLWQAGGNGTGPALVPRPLAVIDELRLVLSEAAGGSHDREGIDGRRVLRPSGVSGRNGGPTGGVRSAEDALVGAAAALAGLHAAGTGEGLTHLCGSAVYAARARQWAAALAGQLPAFAEQLSTAVDALTVALRHTHPPRLVPVHGTFKPSRLVFCGADRPVITDLDRVCLADPALDVGYFLAHLRPPRLWRGQGESRTWFTRAHAVFCEAYLRELAQAGAGACRSGIPARAALFEAAALLKIASRRVRHLNGPRPGELAGVLGEIDVCLRRFGREQTRL